MAEQPPAGDAPETASTAPDNVRDGGTVGPYRLVRWLGEGGMGVVWLAEQLHPVRRQVAIKVIKIGMDTRQVVGRFEAERQALALMDHPAIAVVFDGGATTDGRPYFAMEYVAGEPITKYCDRRQLGIDDRLALFIQVCEGVQHAHQKGIIHRDLKPSNVLVSEQGERPVPKIIDFGVAKATIQPLTERPLYTEMGALVGTLEYMSPEQAELGSLDIDTRTDVYALGVILYELLTGALPFDAMTLREAGLERARRTIRETEPPRPSTRVGLSGVSGTQAATARRLEASRLVRQLRGDLDCITLKALEKSRMHRYQTANALAADVRRYLAHEPITARPPSTVYRAQRFVQRHRTGVAAAVLLTLTLVLGTIGTTIGLVRARAAGAQARLEATTSRQVSDFLINLFEVSDPGESRGNSITAREILDRGAERIRGGLQDEPQVKARLMHTIGRVYESLGLYADGRSLLEEALRTRESIVGPDHLDVAETCARIGDVYRQQGQYEQAEPFLKRALAIRERHLGSVDPVVGESLTLLGILYENAGRFSEAQPLLERALKIHELPGGNERALARTLQNLAILAARQNNYAEAEPLFRRTLATLERTLGPNHPDVGTARHNLAIVMRLMKRYDEAETLFEGALDIRRRALGPRHPSVADTLSAIGSLLDATNRSEAADERHREALSIYEQRLGPEHPSVGRTLDNLASVLVKQRRYGEAESMYRRSLAIREKALPPTHPELANSIHNLGELYWTQKRHADAEPLLRRALAMRETVLGADNILTADSCYYLGLVLRDTNRPADALLMLARAFDVRVAKLDTDDRDRLDATNAYAELLRKSGRSSEADAAATRGTGGRFRIP